MRVLFALCLFAGPASAWEFIPGLPCVLRHAEGSARVELTFDPRVPLYTITIGRDTPLPAPPTFSIRFDGPRGGTISTAMHEMAADGLALTVTDTGFGNVLDGLQFNETATALVGSEQIGFSLSGAAEPVERFRACGLVPSV